MDTATLINQLEGEVTELQATIKVLKARAGATAKASSRTAKPHGRVWSAAARAKMSRLIKARLAAKKKTHAARKTTRKPKQAPKTQSQS